LRILFLSRWFPYPPDNGSKIRIFNLLQELAGAHEVILVTFGKARELENQAALAHLRQVCSAVHVLPYREYRPTSRRALAGLLDTRPRWLVDTFQTAMREVVGEQVRRGCDVILASQMTMAPYALSFPRVPAVLDEVEVSGFEQAIRQSPSRLGRARHTLTWLKLARYLRRSLPHFQACTVASPLERDVLRRMAPTYPSVHVVPNALDLTQYAGPFQPPRPGTLVYTGSLTYSANYDAVDYFLRHIQPLVSRAEPDVQLRITGDIGGVDLNSLPRVRGVEFTGHVQDVRPVVAQSWASVVPLRLGGGTRFKILEALAMGTPVISTSKGVEGLATKHLEHLLVADTSETFAANVVELVRSPRLRQRLSTAGQELVARCYDIRPAARTLRGVLEHVAAGRGSYGHT
jgi:glycosyltransferase involved in cell wall biosynthesis